MTSYNDFAESLAQFEILLPAPLQDRLDLTPQEISLTESILTPGLQTSVTVHSDIHTWQRNYDDFKGQPLAINISKPSLQKFGFNTDMNVAQKVYRISDRVLINYNVEQFVIHACDYTILNDAKSLVSKSWTCASPSAIAAEVLQNCAGVQRLDVEESYPVYDYVAKNIHPFRVVAQQGDAALANGNDPSFVHFMTYENFGTHHFRSLYSLCQQDPIVDSFVFSETGIDTGMNNPYGIIAYNFPCDFDLLSDVLNGIDVNGNNINTLGSINIFSYAASVFNGVISGCGIGSGNYVSSFTNLGTDSQSASCPINIELWAPLRQARMGLLEKDKIALRMAVPWNPDLYAGKVIRLKLFNKTRPAEYNYGSGDYLIHSLTHNIKRGGYATTTMDLCSQTIGTGQI